MKKWLKIGFSLFFGFSTVTHAAHDPLPSWNDGVIKNNIIAFVKSATDSTSPNFMPAEKRIATFDNDGTLWVEHPIYTQAIFMFARVKTLAAQHPEWKNQEPFKSILNNDLKAMEKFSPQDITKLLAVTHTGMSTEAFQEIVKAWLKSASSPRFKHPYTDLIYQPMLEVMQYLVDNQFKVYIVTGGGQDFVRAFSTTTYHVLPEHVIGSSVKTRFSNLNGKVELLRLPEIFLIDDKAGKPIAINLFIGLKPLIAFGNSDGDQEMLEWTQSGTGPKLMLLVHHDDAEREYAYDADTKIGTLSNALMNEAIQNHWQVISMKNDWKKIFSFEVDQSKKVSGH